MDTVAAVYGTCDGYYISFTKNQETGRWEAAVPFDEDGEYVVDIRARDLAGNESYYATVLFLVDTKKLCVTMKILKVSARAKADGLTACVGEFKTSQYKAKVTRCELVTDEFKMTEYRAKVIRCELCGRF